MAANFKVALEYDGERAQFEASAIVPETRRAAYDQYQLVHLPTDLWAYRSTSSRSFGITAKLVSRNIDEAKSNSHVLNLIRKWILPDFAKTGAPPPVLKFYAYFNKNIQNLSVVITDYTWTFDDLTDYIWEGGNPMPVIGMLSLSLVEIYSAREISEVKPWEIKLDGPGSDDGYVVNENSNSQTFRFNRSKKLFGAIGGGGGGTSGSFRGGSGSPHIHEPYTQSTRVSRNPFFVGNAAVSANGVLQQAATQARALDPISGVVAEVVTAVVDGFNRAEATIEPPTPTDLSDV